MSSRPRWVGIKFDAIASRSSTKESVSKTAGQDWDWLKHIIEQHPRLFENEMTNIQVNDQQ
jgi:hypothetical protein